MCFLDPKFPDFQVPRFPSSLDLTNFVVRRCRGGVAEVPRTVRRPAQVRPRPGPGLGLGIWKSGNLEIWKFGIHKIQKKKISKSKSVLPKMSARSGLAEKKNSRPHLGPFGANFSMGQKNALNIRIMKTKIRSAQTVGKVWISYLRVDPKQGLGKSRQVG